MRAETTTGRKRVTGDYPATGEGRSGASAGGDTRQGGPAALLLAILLALAWAMPDAGWAQERVDERRALEADGRMAVEVVSHDIRVRVWDRNEVHVTGTIDPATERFEMTGTDRDLRVRVVHERSGRSGRSGSLEIRVPEEARITLSSVSGSLELEGVRGSTRLESTSGHVRLRGSPSVVEVATVSGGVRVEGESPEVLVQTVSGAIDAEVGSGRVELGTVSGRLHVRAGGPVERARLNSVSGSIHFEGPLTDRASFSAESHSGSVTLRVPPGTPGDYEIGSFSGQIQNGITDDEPRSPRFGPGRTLDFRVGQGTARIRIESFSGRVILEPLR